MGGALLLVAAVLAVWAAATTDRDSTVKLAVAAGVLGIALVGYAVAGWIGVLVAIVVVVLVLLSG